MENPYICIVDLKQKEEKGKIKMLVKINDNLELNPEEIESIKYVRESIGLTGSPGTYAVTKQMAHTRIVMRSGDTHQITTPIKEIRKIINKN